MNISPGTNSRWVGKFKKLLVTVIPFLGMEDIQKLGEVDKGHLFALMDAFLKQNKMQSIM